MNTRTCLTKFIGGAILGLAFLPNVQAADRPKIALALSGGAAYGLTQFGALEWFEEHRIPIDGISGTSGGAIVGAWYATGLELMTDDEIANPKPRRSVDDMKLHGLAEVLSRLNLDHLFHAYPNYKHVDVQDKALQRDFPFGPLAGLPDQSLALTDGLIPGSSLEILFSSICRDFPREYLYRKDGLAPFDHLPTPFRSVAVQPHGYDLKNWQQFSLGSANPLPDAPNYQVSLPDAIRASMAIPYIFTPRYLPPDNPRYGLVDGGTRDNFPTDVACDAFKPDVVIGLHILVDLHPLSLFFKVTGHPEMDPNLEAASNAFKFGQTQPKHPEKYVIPMNTGTASPDRFDQWKKLAWLGYQSMEAYSQTPRGTRLLNLSLSPKDYAVYRNARRLITADAHSKVTFPVPSARSMESESSKAGSGSVGFERTGSANNLEFHPRGFGHFQLYTSPNVQAGTGQWTSANVNFLARDYGLIDQKSSFDFTLKAGSEFSAGTAFNYVPQKGSLFIRPFAGLDDSQQSIFQDGHRTSNLSVSSKHAGLEVGLLAGANWKASAISEFGDLDRLEDAYRQTLAKFEYDSTNSNLNPDQGLKAYGMARRFDGGGGFYQSQAGVLWRLPQGSGNQVSFQIAGGTSFGAQPDNLYDFRLGGDGLMKAYPQDYIRTPGFFYSGSAYTLRLRKIPFFFGDFNWVNGIENAQTGSSSYTDAYSSLDLVTRIGTFCLGIASGNHERPRIFVGLGTTPTSMPQLFSGNSY